MRFVAADVAPTDEITESASSIWTTTVDAVPRVGAALTIVVVGWLVSRGFRWGLRGLLLRRRTPSFAQVMSKVASWLLLGVVVLLAVAVTFPSVRPVDVLAGLGFFSVAVGFAFQDILENTLAGILLLFRQPFRVGDQIDVVGQSGTVQGIDIRETRLVTYDGETVVIPNRDVYKNVLLVHTDREHHRVAFDVGVTYGCDLARATAAITSALAGVPAVEDRPEPLALVAELGTSAVRIRASFWTSARQLDTVRATDAAIKAVHRRLEAEGIAMPPTIVALAPGPGLTAGLAEALAAGVSPDGPRAGQR